jgi:hypothetical protein
MKPRHGAVFLLVATLCGPTAAIAQAAPELPSPEVIVKRSIDAAGGFEAFSRLGILLADIRKDEVAQDGHQTSTDVKDYIMAPGPTPGRIEMPAAQVISGDDGSEGWAVVGGKYDARPEMKIMVKRLLRTGLFSLFLPFSLNWTDVSVTGVTPLMLGNVPVWRLSVSVPKSFFYSPQISTEWTVDVNQKTYAVVQAQSPATDLGRGIKADGMRITWGKPQILRGVTLPGEQRVVGLSETGAEIAHNRVDHVRYELLDNAKPAMLFDNPVPPEQRPQPKVGPDAAHPPAQ